MGTGRAGARRVACAAAAGAVLAGTCMLAVPTESSALTPPPTIAAVSPAVGPATGSTLLTITGTGFATSGTVTVSVGGKPCTTVSVASATSLSCTTSANRSGTADVRVTNPDAQSTTGAGRFTYLSRLANPRALWTEQFGSSASDRPTAIEVGPGGDLWVYGATDGALAGSGHPGSGDVFLARYSKTGARKWIMQFGTSADENAAQRLIVLPNGDAIVAGTTAGILPGNTRNASRSDYDGFIAKITRKGVLKWARQFGGSGNDSFYSVAAGPAGDIYVAGDTDDTVPSGSVTPANAQGGGGDVFAARFDRNGVLRWARQFGASDAEWPWDIAVTGMGEAYIIGTAYGDLDGPSGSLCAPDGCTKRGKGDEFLGRIDRNGTITWMRQTGTAELDEFWGVAIGPGGDVYTAGYTDGFLGTDGTGSSNAPGTDGVVERWSPSGTRLWANQHGTSGADNEWDIEVAPNGDAFTAGYTDGAFTGFTNTGGYDAYVLRVAATGNATDAVQLSTPASDSQYNFGTVLALTSTNGVVVATATQGSVWGQANRGDYDVSLTQLARPGSTSTPLDRRWTAQLGADGSDSVAASGSDAQGNVYVYGQTDGVIEPGRPAGDDVFVAKYDVYGRLAWVRQFGTTGSDQPANQMVVRANGEVFVTGFGDGTYGSQPKASPDTDGDVFVAKLSPSGAIVWFKQYGSTDDDEAWGIAAAANGDLYLAVETAGVFPSGSLRANGDNAGGLDAVLVRLNKYGTMLWAHQFGGTADDAAWSVAVTRQGGVFVVGTASADIGTVEKIGTQDGFVARYNKSGKQQWLRMYGASSASTNLWGAAAASDGSVYALGDTTASVGTVGPTAFRAHQGGRDAVVYRINAIGTVRWVHQVGSDSADILQTAVVARNGWLYAGGTTAGAIAPFSNQGQRDSIVYGISPDGKRSTIRQFGTEATDGTTQYGIGVALRPDGKLVMSTVSTTTPWGTRTPVSSEVFTTAMSTPSATPLPAPA